MSIDEQVSQAMEQWDKETNCGETDPAFQGEVDEEINKLVDGLKQDDVDKLMKVDKPIIFVEGQHATYESVEVGPTFTYDKESKRYSMKRGKEVVFNISKEDAAVLYAFIEQTIDPFYIFK